MKLTIVPIDKVVIVDGVAIHDIDMTGIDPDIHAVQFDGNGGWIEYKDRDPEQIDSVSRFDAIIARHASALAEEQAKAADPYYGMSPEEKLAAIRQEKIIEIDAAFALAEQQPVGVGGYKFKGGFTSVLALDGERRGIIEENNAIIAGFLPEEPPPGSLHTTVTFFTVDGVLVQVPLFDTEQIDAVDVCQAVRMQASYNSFKCERLMAAAKAATTIEAINAIKW